MQEVHECLAKAHVLQFDEHSLQVFELAEV